MNCLRTVPSMIYCRFLYVLAFFPATFASAATITFTGQTDTDWTTPSNWMPSEPTSGDLARVFGASSVAEISAGSAVASYVDIRQDGTLNITGGSLTFGFSNNRWMWLGWQTPGTVNQSGGVVSTSGSNVDVIVDDFGTYNMTGGTLNISDDLRLEGNAVFNITGSSAVNIGDDLRVANESNVEFNVELVGDVPPLISVADDLVLRNTTSLNIDSTNWTGGSEITLFDAGDRVVGQFASVTLDGVAVPASQYQFSSGSVIISVSEPTSTVLPLMGVLVGIPFLGVIRRNVSA